MHHLLEATKFVFLFYSLHLIALERNTENLYCYEIRIDIDFSRKCSGRVSPIGLVDATIFNFHIPDRILLQMKPCEKLSKKGKGNSSESLLIILYRTENEDIVQHMLFV